jgi:hypothetical protein
MALRPRWRSRQWRIGYVSARDWDGHFMVIAAYFQLLTGIYPKFGN